MVTTLNTIKARMISSKENFVLSISSFQAGSAFNVIPDDATLMGTLRTYNPKVIEAVKSKIIQITRSTASAFGCKVEFEFNDKYPPTVNPQRETEHVIRVAKKNFGENKVTDKDLPTTGSEDFAYYLLNKPGCFYALGT